MFSGTSKKQIRRHRQLNHPRGRHKYPLAPIDPLPDPIFGPNRREWDNQRFAPSNHRYLLLQFIFTMLRDV